jgi:DNA-binding MarR family transcriptional regulator
VDLPAQQPREELFGRVFVLFQQLTRRVDEVLAPLGLTSRQWLLLVVLVRGFPGVAPTLSEAAAVFGTSRQNVKQIAGQLAARGYLTLDADPADARATRLVLTDRVAEFDEPSALAEQQAVLDELFACFSADEIATLEALVRRWVEHLGAPEVTR